MSVLTLNQRCGTILHPTDFNFDCLKIYCYVKHNHVGFIFENILQYYYYYYVHSMPTYIIWYFVVILLPIKFFYVKVFSKKLVLCSRKIIIFMSFLPLLKNIRWYPY